METKFIHDTSKFIRGLDQNQLKFLESTVRKELARRKKISDKNIAWQCGHGLEACLEASITKPVVYKPVPGGRSQPVADSSGEFAEKLEQAIEERFGKQS